MSIRVGVLSKKVGMTNMFLGGERISVSLLSLEGCRVVGKRDYSKGPSLIVGFGSAKKASKPYAGFFKDLPFSASEKLAEFPITQDCDVEVGSVIMPSHFSLGQFVDVTSVSKGKGFAGVMKRHNFGGLCASHGVSRAHRKPGSTGQNQDPGKVFKGKKMPGRMGGNKVTVQNLKVVFCDDSDGLIGVEGGVPGFSGAFVRVFDSVKKGVFPGAAVPGVFSQEKNGG
jgi:large subunit ribosomal protein L3